MRNWGRVALAVLALLLPASTRAEDLTIVSKIVGQGPESSRTWYLTSSKLRMSEDLSDVIMDVTTGKLTFLDHSKKQYWEATVDELNRAAAEASTRMSEQMKQNPQAARMIEQMGGLTPTVSIQKGTGTKKIAGYSCDQYIVTMGSLIEDIWVTPEITPPMTLSQIMSAQTAFFAGNPMASSLKSLASEVAKIKGFPLGQSVSITLMGRTQQSASEAVEVKKGPVPASTFSIPPGYSRISPPSLGTRRL